MVMMSTKRARLR